MGAFFLSKTRKEMDIINTYHLFILKKEKIFYVSTKISLKHFQPQMQCKINVLNLTEGFNKCDFLFSGKKNIDDSGLDKMFLNKCKMC